MNLKSSEKAALMVILGIAVCALSIIYIAKPKYEEKQRLDAEIVQLDARLRELQAKQADREKYEAGIVEYTAKYEEVLSHFPGDLNQEITIMFLEGIKDDNDFDILSLGLGEKTPFYTMGSSIADATLDNTAATSGTDAATDATATDAAAAADAAAADGGLQENTGEQEVDQLVCYSAEFPINYTGSYKSLKDVVDYIDNFSDRMTVNALDITMTDAGEYTGNLQLFCYSVEGQDRPERSIEINQVETGVENIFEGTNYKPKSDASLNKYDDQDGKAIEASYDFYAMLNASTSDVSAKVIGQNGNDKDKTVITNSDNSVSTLKYEFYETDGKVYCKYTLDDNQSYEAEVVSAEDVKVLIQSSTRKNEEDKVGLKVIISNSTSLPVYVKVSGDDAVSPRVSVSKSGSVKVYQ